MLVLTRKVGETILIGDTITVTLVRVQGDKIRVGIDAPADVQILREEVRDRLLGTRDPAPAGATARQAPLARRQRPIPQPESASSPDAPPPAPGPIRGRLSHRGRG
jgi:carbon storage regulator